MSLADLPDDKIITMLAPMLYLLLLECILLHQTFEDDCAYCNAQIPFVLTDKGMGIV